jgi:hypothetical protein
MTHHPTAGLTLMTSMPVCRPAAASCPGPGFGMEGRI